MIVRWNLEVRETPSYLGSLSVYRHWILWSPTFRQYSITTDPTCLCVRVARWPDGLSGQRTWVAEAWHEDNPARAWLLAILRAL